MPCHDDDLATRLEERAHARGVPFKTEINEAIAIERGARLATFDTDSHRFHGLRVDYLG